MLFNKKEKVINQSYVLIRSYVFFIEFSEKELNCNKFTVPLVSYL